MFNPDGPTMEVIFKVVGAASTTLGGPIVAKIFKRSQERMGGLARRADRLKKFFDDGGIRQEPILMEASFAAAVGDGRIQAREIPLLLAQANPTLFLKKYLKVRDYLVVDNDGLEFRQKRVVENRGLRLMGIYGGLAVYFFVGMSAALLLFFYGSKFITSGNFYNISLFFILLAFMFFISIISLTISTKISVARQIFLDQERL